MLILQAGDALDDLGHGLSIPFEIRDLHPYRGFPPSTGGLVLAAIRARAARAPRAA